MRVSGKMIVDGICVQFLGCFDCSSQRPKHADQQIEGVGRVELDPDYYQQLSLAQVCERSNDQLEQKPAIEPSQPSTNRPRTSKSKESTKPVTRSRTISENSPAKNRTSASTTPPATMPTSRTHPHSPGHKPYPLRSPRTMSNVAKQRSLTSPATPATSGRTSDILRLRGIPLLFSSQSLVQVRRSLNILRLLQPSWNSPRPSRFQARPTLAFPPARFRNWPV